LPALEEALRDAPSSDKVMSALASMSEAHARGLAVNVANARPQEAWTLANALRKAGPTAVAWAAPELLAALEADDTSPRTASLIVRVLGTAEPRTEAIRAALRARARLVAAAFRSEGETDFYRDGEELKAIGEDAADAVPALGAALRRGGSTAEAAAQGLEAIGPAAADAADALADAMLSEDDEDRMLPYYAAHALEAIGPAAVPALVRLLAHAHSAERRLSGMGYRADGAIRGIGEAALPRVIDLVREDPENAAAVEALGSVGPAGTSELLRVLDEGPAIVRLAAVRALRRAGSRSAAAAERVVPLVADADPEVRLAAAEALATFGPSGIPALVAALALAPPPDALARVVRALGEAGPQSAEAAPALAALVEHEDAGIRLAAVRSLGLLGTYAADGAPALRRALDDADPEVAASARRALARVAGG
jgi:hypothetical protein